MYRVLLVDDEPSVCKGFQKLIHWEECGFQVVATASNGEEALRMHQAEKFDLIVTDLKMPVMGGLQLIRAIHESPEASCQIIIVSAYGEFSVAQEAMRYGVDYYLLKPIEETVMEGFLSQIKEKLDAHEKPLTKVPDHELIENQYRISTNGVITEIKTYINDHYAESLSLNQLAVKFSFSPVYLGRLFKREVGTSFNEYLKRVRIQAACDLLRDSDVAVNELAEKIGFNDLNYFYRLFKQATGMTPNQYRTKDN